MRMETKVWILINGFDGLCPIQKKVKRRRRRRRRIRRRRRRRKIIKRFKGMDVPLLHEMKYSYMR